MEKRQGIMRCIHAPKNDSEKGRTRSHKLRCQLAIRLHMSSPARKAHEAALSQCVCARALQVHVVRTWKWYENI